MAEKRFKVALSFPSEQRKFVKEVAQVLAQQFGAEKVLYDEFFEAEFARADLSIYLPRLYAEQSELVVVFLCGEYAQKQWCGLEWLAIHEIIKQKDYAGVMFIRFDNAKLDGIYSGAGYVNAPGHTPEEIAQRIIERYQSNQGQVPTPRPIPPRPGPLKFKWGMVIGVLLLALLGWNVYSGITAHKIGIPGIWMKALQKEVPPSNPELARLVSQINASDDTQRKAAVDVLTKKYLSDPALVTLLLDGFDETMIAKLSAPGRINAFFILQRIPANVWTAKLITRAEQVITRVETRNTQGTLPMGLQEQDYKDKLKTYLAQIKK
jgi:hypothetical protein